MDIVRTLCSELGKSPEHVSNVIELIDGGSTIPFIARYRKELHGGMDDTSLRKLAERLEYLRGLDERRTAVLSSIEAQGKLTEELRAEIDSAETLARLEDIYRPFRPKKRTRAQIAREKGLEPLAAAIMLQGREAPEELAERFLSEREAVSASADAGSAASASAAASAPAANLESLTIEEALVGARDIIAEMISDDAASREKLRSFIGSRAKLRSEALRDEDSVYRLYYDFSQPVAGLQGHRVLAIDRGEREGWLKVSVELDEERAKDLLAEGFVRGSGACSAFVREASDDAFSRLILPSLTRELRARLTDEADEGAIRAFALNLSPLLMQPPVRGSVVMGLDPGYRNGCKVAVVDATGKLLDTAVVYPAMGDQRREEAMRKLTALIVKHGVKHIAIGNGTASRETEAMAAEMLKRLGAGQSYAIVNEAGASVWSASESAAEEFPSLDVNLRSAVSIARRLQDPLAELVKIDPMSIGVGQYQHDMPKARLAAALDGVVEDCVNAVGVDVNTASPALLRRVAGLSASTAANLVKYREEHGALRSRAEIKKVKGLGPKAFEQCAGFLRVPGSREILDETAVHPESYAAARTLLALTGYSEDDVRQRRLAGLKDRVAKLGSRSLAESCGVGVPTLTDIVGELMKPGRDPREELPPVLLRSDVLEMKDLKPGMKLSGTVRNVTDFGAFVDIGVHRDGLVHISEIADRFIKHPSDALSVGDVVDVVVLEADEKKGRISLSIRRAGNNSPFKQQKG